MSHKAPLPAPKAPEKSTLNKKFVSWGNPERTDGPFVGLRFQELSRDESVTPSTITLKFYNRVITVKLSDYREWKEEAVEV